MDHRLGMDHNVNPIATNAEQRMRLDHLEAFVHQRRRIDRDLAAHPPGGMLERVGRRNIAEVRRRAPAKWTAGGGENQSLQLARLPPVQALMDSIVLAVDR